MQESTAHRSARRRSRLEPTCRSAQWHFTRLPFSIARSFRANLFFEESAATVTWYLPALGNHQRAKAHQARCTSAKTLRFWRNKQSLDFGVRLHAKSDPCVKGFWHLRFRRPTCIIEAPVSEVTCGSRALVALSRNLVSQDLAPERDAPRTGAWDKISHNTMALSAGTRLGPYEILSPIGAGGMGEVYKARDTRLDRIVAIKVSKEKFSERFEHEARAIAALNHPHICTLYDVGPNYLVMEYVEGGPLKGPLPLDQALHYAVQICDALDAAHRKGITHRDVKPGNILVTRSGVKLLDFGLANRSLTPVDGVTQSMPLTAPNTILGTIQYMAPEQLEGKPADARSDIFSFGLILYEMLTGKRAFQASSPASLIAAILKEEPPPLLSFLPLTPRALDRTLEKCLAKDPERRWQSARDLKDELAWISVGDVTTPRAVPRRAVFPWIAGAAAAGLAGGVGLEEWARRGKESPAAARGFRFRLAPMEGAVLERNITLQTMALSPVGGRLAMIATNERGTMIWVQRMDSLTASPLEGTEGATLVFWSSDGQFIGFWAGGKMKKIPADGGTPLAICNLPIPWSATWNQDRVVTAASAAVSTASFRISVKLGTINPMKPILWPKFLPGGRHLLYVNIDRKIGGYRAYVVELSTGRETALMPTDTHVIFVPDQLGSTHGYLLFGRSSTLLALRFDADHMSVAGEPAAVAKEVPFFGPTAWSEFDASLDGVLIYSAGSKEAQIMRLSRGGRELGEVGDRRDFFGYLRLSPDGKKLAADVFDLGTGGTDIWAYDLSHQATAERVTFEPGVESGPVWSPDGARIAFGSAQAGPPQLRVKALGDRGSGDVFPSTGFQFPHDWSSDGRWILYGTSGGDDGELWLASASDRKIRPLMQTPCGLPALSPNRDYLAFSASDAGHSEIYVQHFQGGDSPKLIGDRRRVSYNGGRAPRWRRDGKELFFISPGREMMAVAVKSGTESDFGTPTALFRLPTSYRALAPVFQAYEVSPDGQEFLVIIRRGATAALQVVVNWQAALKG